MRNVRVVRQLSSLDAQFLNVESARTYGHVAFQAQRSDVHTVIVDGRVVKHDGRLVGIDLAQARRAIDDTVEFAARTLGDEAWTAGMHPEIPETTILENPYQYTQWDAGAAQWKR